MTRLRPYLALCLTLILVLTTQSLAVARAAPDTAGSTEQIEICTGQGPAVISLDSQEQPSSSRHMCPDCTLGKFAATEAPAPLLPLRIASVRDATPCTLRVSIRCAPVLTTRARAPPR